MDMKIDSDRILDVDYQDELIKICREADRIVINIRRKIFWS